MIQEKREANDWSELFYIWRESLHYDQRNKINGVYIYVIEGIFDNLVINFHFDFTVFRKHWDEGWNYKLDFGLNGIIFQKCIFKEDVVIDNTKEDASFIKGCTFEKAIISKGTSNNLLFKNCILNEVNFEDGVFGIEEKVNDKKGKVRFHDCRIQKANFRNTTFHGLADFWKTTFNNRIIFYKTDFLNITVFSAVTFKDNVLFTYSLFNSKTIFRGTKPEKGMDLSLAIISGELNLFDLNLKYFKHSEPLTEEDYEHEVSEVGSIPLKNKQETYRILKKKYEAQSDNIRALDFKYLERTSQSRAIAKEIFRAKRYKNEHFLDFIYAKLKAFINQIIHVLNLSSNGYGKSYILGLVFTFTLGILFFSLSLLCTSIYKLSDFTHPFFIIENNVSHFLNFLNPAHKFNYLGKEFAHKTFYIGFYIWDFVGRIFVGYGIYQTIQAFRKYR
ncbi:Pentapeptide repeat-containing protein [Tenacibaculum sp. MAR_2009_124]|uniref:pentapeptide repeat-containing protein n=1 Tax=Tenacibaculum sp. MAR_2009_124 TaxID=1250059 RepID=UPI000895D91E|nr:pentapeptide repeat-containing protein [Tenacibaculum sp. MAR_2009_124]SEB35718.1 Pentapeptide repeat-containing protein [Tenacibaculum sp. MAR_2009_124]